MAKREPDGRNSLVAKRLRQLRKAESIERASDFADRLGVSVQRWNNFENGFPLSKEIAIQLVQTIPGLTLDWLFLGRTEGLTINLARRLGELKHRNTPDDK
jgi:transcriptional regulator with XRE-family HTH domain